MRGGRRRGGWLQAQKIQTQNPKFKEIPNFKPHGWSDPIRPQTGRIKVNPAFEAWEGGGFVENAMPGDRLEACATFWVPGQGESG